MKLLYTCTEARSIEIKPASFLIDPLIPASGMVLVHGKFSTYKTPLALCMAYAIATGKNIWGLHTNQATPVLFVQCDTTLDGFLPRIHNIHDHYLNGSVPDLDIIFGYPGFDVTAKTQTDSHQTELIATLQQQHRDRKYKIVFVDSLRAVHALDDKNSDAVSRIYKSLASLFYGATVVVVHHDKKTRIQMDGKKIINLDQLEDVSSETFSGSQALINHAQSAIKIDFWKKDQNEIALRHTKNQVGERMHSILVLKPSVDTEGTPQGVFSTAVELGVEMVAKAAKQGIFQADWKARDKDIAIAKHFHVSERTARELRLAWVAGGSV